VSVPPFASLRAAAADGAPALVVVAGPNGAGKSTFIRRYLRDLDLPYVNADHIATVLRAAHPGLSQRELDRQAFEEAERLRDDLLPLRFGFCTETVFSDPVGAKLDFLERARAGGFFVTLVFICLTNPAISIGRVQQRVAEGGHDVPADRLLARFPRTLRNLRAAIPIVSETFLFDNSSADVPHRFVARYEGGRLAALHPPLPRWTKELPGL
jgi:predicted ABC-type ATPase